MNNPQSQSAYLPTCIFILCSLLYSCKSGTVNLFKPASPHEQYQRRLSSAGLDHTAMGNSWINNSVQALQKPLTITIPFKQTGYFAAEKIPAAAYRFQVQKGQRLKISLLKKPDEQFMVYVDVWEERTGNAPKLIASADTLGNTLQLDADISSFYLIRLQPELLRSGEYTLEISAGPSLAFPVKSSGTIQSFFGDGRDADSRKHEGIDIFAPKLTPAVASSAGTVTRVNQNNLGGNVVWMRPDNKDYTLYYAHLDKQIAVEGQRVAVGDTLGLVGNTGNARTTAAHLHFGIYGAQGAVDPLPYVNSVVIPAPRVTAALSNLNATVRTNRATGLRTAADNNAPLLQSVKDGTILHIQAASGSWYQAELPSGEKGFIPGAQVSSTAKPLRQIRISSQQQNIYDQPDSLAAVKKTVAAGTSVGLLGNFGNYALVIDSEKQTGWINYPGK